MKVLSFTAVNPVTYEETILHIAQSDSGNTVIKTSGRIRIDQQQLAELGTLFLTLAGDNYDEESCEELLDGYGLLK